MKKEVSLPMVEMNFTEASHFYGAKGNTSCNISQVLPATFSWKFPQEITFPQFVLLWKATGSSCQRKLQVPTNIVIFKGKYLQSIK